MKRKGLPIEEVCEKNSKRSKNTNKELLEFPSLPKFFNELSKEICFSFIQNLICFTCDKKIVNNEDIINCLFCSKIFHVSCHSKEEFVLDKCKFCLYNENEMCVICFKKDDKSIKIYCEFCGNFMHFLCFNIPLRVLFDRLIYKYFPEEFVKYLKNSKDFGNFFVLTDVTEEKLTEISKNYNILPPFIFNICNFCSKKENEGDLDIYNCHLFQGRVYFKVRNRKKSKIHEFYHYQQKLVENELISNLGIKITELNHRIIEKYTVNQITNSPFSYFLIKWKKNNEVKYTFEHSIFVENVENFKQSLFSFYSRRENYSTKLQSGCENYQTLSKERIFILKESLNKKLKDFLKDIKLESETLILTNFFEKFYENFLNRNFFIPFYYEQKDFYKEFLLSNVIIEKKENKKIIICTDNDQEKKYWKDLLKSNKIDVKSLSKSFKFLKLISEILFIDFSKVEVNIQSLIDIFNPQAESTANGHILNLIENITLTWKMFKFEVLLLDLQLYINDYAFLSKFQLDLILFDLEKFESIRQLENIIKSTPYKIIILQKQFKKFNEFNTELVLNVDAFCLFFTKNTIFTNNPTLKTLNKKSIFIEDFTYSNYMHSLNWQILVSSNYCINTNPPSYIKYNECQNKINLVFVPIVPCLKDVNIYWKIVEQINDKYFLRFNENKSNIINNLILFCSFPRKISYSSIIKENKYASELSLSKKIFLPIFLNKVKEYHYNNNPKFKIITFNCQEVNDDLELFTSIQQELQNLKMENIYFNTVEEFLENEMASNEETIFIILNVSYSSTRYSDFFIYLLRRLNDSKASIFVYQLYLKYTIEENCLTHIYSNYIDLMFENKNLLLILNKEEKENLIQFGIHYLKKYFIRNKEILNEYDKVLNINDRPEAMVVLKNHLLFYHNFPNNINNIQDKKWKWEEILNLQNLNDIIDINLTESQETSSGAKLGLKNTFLKSKKIILDDEDKFSDKINCREPEESLTIEENKQRIDTFTNIYSAKSKYIIEDRFNFELTHPRIENLLNHKNFTINNMSFNIQAFEDIPQKLRKLHMNNNNSIDDLLTILEYHFISAGFISIVKEHIINYIYKWGINFRNMEDYCDQLQNNIKHCLGILVNTEDIYFFLSMLMFIINNHINPKIKHQIKFFLNGNHNITNLKKVILVIDKIKGFLDRLSIDNINCRIKNYLNDIKIKNLNHNNSDTFIILILNLLRCVLECGYGNYTQFLDSNTIKKGFLQQRDFCSFLGVLICDNPNVKRNQLMMKIEELYKEIEFKLLFN